MYHYSFCATLAEEINHDMRFVYSAAAVCFILKDWSGMNVPLTTNFIMKSLVCDISVSNLISFSYLFVFIYFRKPPLYRTIALD